MLEGLRSALLFKQEEVAKYFITKGIWIDARDWIPNPDLYEQWRNEIDYD